MSKIQSITALEILDSRGNPTVSVTVTLSDGITASASVPLPLVPARVTQGNLALTI